MPEQSKTTLGIELGSTRIKAVLIGPDHTPLISGAHDWENHWENNYWTYPLSEVWQGIQNAVAELLQNWQQTYGQPLTHVGAFGVSAMMHGYLPFDKNGNQLAEFRTWRNTCTAQAAEKLTERFAFNIPQRWSIAHLYQAMLNGEEHLPQIAQLTTLAGYVHYKLTGCNVMGIGEASGMFPIDSNSKNYNAKMMASFNQLLQEHHLPYTLEQILPTVLCAGEDAGRLTEEGAKLLDPSGTLQAGALACPPEGDAGTGMVATNSVGVRTGNVSAGTSVFAMIVLEKELSQVYPEIDMVTTPTGCPVAMVHCNTCTSDLDAWVRLLGEMAQAAGAELHKNKLYQLFYQKALEGEADCGGLVNFNYYSGEPVTGLEDGRPMLLRHPNARLNLANLARVQLYSAMATLKLGMDMLVKEEDVRVDCMMGHGGMFKVPMVGQKLMASALEIPVAVQKTAGEGGPWGMALLAAYRMNKKEGQTLEQYLVSEVFATSECTTCHPEKEESKGFEAFIRRYTACIPVEQAAVQALQE